MAEIKDILTRLKNYIDQEDNNEQTRAENAEEALNDKIEQEIADRTADVNAEEARAQEAESVLASDIATEETRASNEETRIEDKLDDYISSNNQALADEAAARAQADTNEETRAKAEELRIETKLDNRIDTEIQDRKDDVDAEELRATTAEVALNTRIDNLDVNLIGENGYYLKTIKQDDGKITATTEQIENEWGVLSHLRVPSSKLVKDTIDTEVTRATNKENVLETRIGTEESTRASEVTRLDTKIDNGSTALDTKIEAEKTRAMTKESQLEDKIGALDLPSTGIAGQYIRTVSQENGQLAADPVSFDVDFNNPSNNNAPTTKAINDRFALISEAGTTFDLTLNQSNYKITLALKNRNGFTLKSETIDLPLESVVVSGRYDDNTRQVILTLQDGSTISFSVADLIRGLQSEINEDNTLDSDLVDDSISTIHKFVTATEKAQITTNQNAIAAIKDGNIVDSFRDVEDELNKKVDKISGKGLSANDYTNEAVANVAANTSARHTHANKNLLDTYTQTEADLAAAVTNTHTHNNKQILDDTTASFTIAYKNQLDTTAVSVDYDHTKFYKTLPTGQGSDIVTVDTLSADLAAANTLSISGTHGSITAAQYSKLNKETIVIWEAPDHSGNVALHYSSLVNVDEPSYQGFYGLPFTDGMVTVLVTFKDDLTWEAIYDGAVAETTANRVSAFQNTPDNTHYPTEKLVKDNLDTKANLDAENIFTGKNTFSVPDVNSGLGFLITPSNPQNMRSKVSLYVKGPVVIENPSFDDESSTLICGSTRFEQLGDPGALHSQSVVFNIPARFDRYTLFKDASNAYVRTTLTISDESVNCDTSLSTISDFFWNTHKAYAVGDIIFYSRALYICEVTVSASSVGNMDPTADTTHWTRLFTNQA